MKRESSSVVERPASPLRKTLVRFLGLAPIVLAALCVFPDPVDAGRRSSYLPFSTDYIPPAYRKRGAPAWHPKPGEKGSVGVFVPQQPTLIIPNGPIIVAPR